MSEDDTPPSGPSGTRKDGKPYAEGNTLPDGSYAVGRNRTPEEHRFKKGDGRKRGRRPKGVRNADTEFERELNKVITIRENGQSRKVTKGHAADLRLIENAHKGDNRAIEMVDRRRQRIAEKAEDNARFHSLRDVELLERFIRQRQAELEVDPDLFGDPIEPATESGDHSDGEVAR